MRISTGARGQRVRSPPVIDTYPASPRENVIAGRSARPHGEIPTIMASLADQIQSLELELLRRGVGALAADRNRCADCGRTPLTGEEVHIYGGRRQRIVCELCRPARRGAPLASELVRHSEHGHTVRLAVRAA